MSEREIRITSGGKMKNWISHALDCLQKDETKPIVLHTLPNPPSKRNPKCLSSTNPTMLVPRLVSVVEIIKREYIKTLELSHSTRLLGLHQYNQVGSLEELGLAPVVSDSIDEGGEQRAENLIKALEGKNIKHVQTPYMKITLSLVELPELKGEGATYQPPLQRKMSKSAKARAKKREKKADGSAGGLASEAGN